MECRVKSPSKPVATWYKDGVPIQEGSLYAFVSADLGDSVYLLQLEIRVGLSLFIWNNVLFVTSLIYRIWKLKLIKKTQFFTIFFRKKAKLV